MGKHRKNKKKLDQMMTTSVAESPSALPSPMSTNDVDFGEGDEQEMRDTNGMVDAVLDLADKPMRKLNYRMRVISASDVAMENEEMKEDEIDDDEMDAIATMQGVMNIHGREDSSPSATNVSEMMYGDDELG